MSGTSLKQRERLNSLVVVFTSDGWKDEELKSNRLCKGSVMMRVLQYLVVLKRELLKNAKLSTSKTDLFPSILTYGHGHESWPS